MDDADRFRRAEAEIVASIVAISAIQVLKAFMNLEKSLNEKTLPWLVGIHVVFVISGLRARLDRPDQREVQEQDRRRQGQIRQQARQEVNPSGSTR